MVETREQIKARMLMREVQRAKVKNSRVVDNINRLNSRIRDIRKKYSQMAIKK